MNSRGDAARGGWRSNSATLAFAFRKRLFWQSFFRKFLHLYLPI